MALSIPILSSLDTKGFDKAAREFDNLQGVSAKTSFALKKAFLPAVAALGALGTAAFAAAKMASDLNEETSKSQVIFGAASTAVMDFSKTAATSLGQSQTEALKAAGTFGVLGKAAGLTGTDLGAMAVQFTKLASDLASFNNTSPEDAVLALGAGLRGEAEPLRRYGILLDDATLRQKALAIGLVSTTKDALTPQNKSLAAQAVILEQTSMQQGDFARTADGAANKQRILTAQIKDAKTNIGSGFLPVMAIAVELLSKFAKFTKDNAPLVIGLAIAVGGLAAAVVLANFAINAYTTFTKVAAAVQKAWNAAMLANPIGVIVVAVLAVIAVMVLLYKNFEGFRNVVNTVVNAVIGYFEFMVNGWIKAINLFAGGINKFTGIFRKVGIPIGELGTIGEVSFGRIGEASKQSAQSVRAFEEGQKTALPAVKSLADATDLSSAAHDKAAAAAKKTADATAKAKAAAKELAEELVTLKDALRDKMAAALEAANTVLDAAIEKFNAFSKSVGESIQSSYSFSDAQKTAAENVAAVGAASAALAIAQQNVATAIADSDPEALTKAYADLAAANKALNDAQSSPQSFLDNLRVQAEKVKDFGVLVNRLLAAGLSESALQQVLAAGVDGGTLIAEELLGSAGAILEANTLTASVQSIADTVGANSARQFYQAGVTAGTNLVAGIQAVVDSYTIRLNAATNATQVGELGAGFAADSGAVFAGGGGPIVPDFSQIGQLDFRGLEEFLRANPINLGNLGGIGVGGLPTLAAGGIVTAPTLAMIGEGNGPEAVIPLNRLNDYTTGNGETNVTINVNGGDPNAVVAAIQRYVRQSGAVPLTTRAI